MNAEEQSLNGVVVQLAEGGEEKAVAVMRNVENLLEALGPDWSVELVAHGPGISAVCVESPMSEKVLGVIARGVRVDACGNTMRRQEIPDDRLLSGVNVVESGLAQLVIRQSQGWSYVRP